MPPYKAKKPGYQETLQLRTRELLKTLLEEEPTEDSRADLERLIYETLKETALESWNNGIKAGMERANKKRVKFA